MSQLVDLTLTSDNASFDQTIFQVESDNPVQWIGEVDPDSPSFSAPTIKLLSGLDKGNRSLSKARVAIAIPVLEAVTGSTSSGYQAPAKIAFTLRADLTLIMPTRASLSQKKAIISMLIVALQENQIRDTLESGILPH